MNPAHGLLEFMGIWGWLVSENLLLPPLLAVGYLARHLAALLLPALPALPSGALEGVFLAFFLGLGGIGRVQPLAHQQLGGGQALEERLGIHTLHLFGGVVKGAGDQRLRLVDVATAQPVAA